MNIPFFSHFFNQKITPLKLPDSILVKKLKEVFEENNIVIYENTTIYHHAKSYFIPLLAFDKHKGIYQFEHKRWTYDELKNSTISKASHQEKSYESLSFENTQDIIRTKINELTHKDSVNIYNFLLMENLSSQEYEHLDDSFKELLPKEKIFFSDSDDEEILKKIHMLPDPSNKLSDEANVMGNLLIQYLILTGENTVHIANQEQKELINSTINSKQVLLAMGGSGKTSSLLLKAILEKLKEPKLKIVMIQPTILACDIAKKKLLELIEYAIVVVDLSEIEIITPKQLLNRHLSKLKKTLLDDKFYVDKILMKKKFNVADFILCDDCNLLDDDFVLYLKHIQNEKPLLLVNDNNSLDVDFKYLHEYRQELHDVEFIQANPHAKCMQTISKLLREHEAKDIMVISSSLSKEQLIEDLNFFIEDKAYLLDSSKSLIYQELDNLLLCSYDQISGLSSKYTILMDVSQHKQEFIKYALEITTLKSYILYEENSQEIDALKEKYENY